MILNQGECRRFLLLLAEAERPPILWLHDNLGFLGLLGGLVSLLLVRGRKLDRVIRVDYVVADVDLDEVCVLGRFSGLLDQYAGVPNYVRDRLVGCLLLLTRLGHRGECRLGCLVVLAVARVPRLRVHKQVVVHMLPKGPRLRRLFLSSRLLSGHQ